METSPESDFNQLDKRLVDFRFKDISYSVENEGHERYIIRKVSGYIPAGRMLAIMGPSGAGKTSLLDVLAGRQKTGTVSGYLTVAGKPRPANFMQISGYVMQDNAFLETLTVRETISYSLRFRLPPTHSQGREAEIVQNIIDIMRLNAVADTQIGDPLNRGISGGEARRLAIAVEMVVSPSILFLDEPTSGLDATNSLKVMAAMKMLCLQGHTIITTIHQPRSDIYKMFDYLLLLYAGETIFYGLAEDALPYFSKLGLSCPDYVNPADFLLDMLDDEVADESVDRSVELNDAEDDFDTRVIIRTPEAVVKDDFATVFSNSSENQQLSQNLCKSEAKNEITLTVAHPRKLTLTR